jgi:hypothetical protein
MMALRFDFEFAPAHTGAIEDNRLELLKINKT